MVCNRLRVFLILCTLWFIIPCPALNQRIDSASGAEGSGQIGASEVSPSVTDWFAKYDQIRREAEMTFFEKFQTMHLNSDKPQKKNAALASKMLAKYTTALSAMKQLPSIPETRELQDRYTEYFTKASQLFSDFVDAQTKDPYPSESLAAGRKELESFDKSNKILDRDLRIKYSISKHKHI